MELNKDLAKQKKKLIVHLATLEVLPEVNASSEVSRILSKTPSKKKSEELLSVEIKRDLKPKIRSQERVIESLPSESPRYDKSRKSSTNRKRISTLRTAVNHRLSLIQKNIFTKVRQSEIFQSQEVVT